MRINWLPPSFSYYHITFVVYWNVIQFTVNPSFFLTRTVIIAASSTTNNYNGDLIFVRLTSPLLLCSDLHERLRHIRNELRESLPGHTKQGDAGIRQTSDSRETRLRHAGSSVDGQRRGLRRLLLPHLRPHKTRNIIYRPGSC